MMTNPQLLSLFLLVFSRPRAVRKARERGFCLWSMKWVVTMDINVLEKYSIEEKKLLQAGTHWRLDYLRQKALTLAGSGLIK